MTDAIYTVFTVVGILSFIGIIAVAAGSGYYMGKMHERQRISGNFRLVNKAVWGVGETGMLVNLTQKRLVVLPGDKHPESVSVVFTDSTIVLKPSSVADSSGFLQESIT